jgi:hypothetical protein
MNCEQARELTIEFLYNELPSELFPKLQEHLAECEGCLRYKEEIQQTLECLNQREEARAPMDFAILYDTIDRKQRQIWQFGHRRWLVWGTAIVGMCGVIFSIFTLFVSEIRYEDNALTIRFNGRKTDSLSERTARILAAYREDQLRFQRQLSNELRASVTALSQMIDEYEYQRDKQIADAFQQIQIQQHQALVEIQKELEILASQTENEFRRSYLAMSELVNSQ